MDIITFAILCTLGAGFWLLGHYWSFAGVATIGGIIVLAAGGSVVMTDLTYQTGEQIEKNHTVVDNETVVSNVSVTEVREPVAIQDTFSPVTGFSVGALTMIVGGLLVVQHINDISLG